MSYTEVETAKATFRLLHGLAGKKSSNLDFPAKFEAALVEMVHQPPIEDIDQRIQAYVAGLENHPDLKILTEKIKESRARVYFGDLAESPSLSTVRDLDLMVIEFMAGLLVLGQGINWLLGKKKRNSCQTGKKSTKRAGIVKRNSLIISGLTLIALGTWLLSSVVEILGIFLVQAVGNTAKRGLLTGIRETIAQASNLHPEKTVVYLRNLVLAEKAGEAAELESKGHRRPLILLDFHFGHAGLVRILKWKPAKRQALLRLYRPFIKDILKDPVRRDYLERLTSVFWDGKSWQLERNYLVDSLEAL